MSLVAPVLPLLVMAWAPPVHANATVDEMLKHSAVIDIPAEEIQQAKEALAEDKVPEGQQRYLASEQQLEGLAKKLGRGEDQVPSVDGACLDKAGLKYSCKPFTGQRLNSVTVGGIPDCRDKVVRAISDLQVKVLKRVQSGRSTGNEYYDRFFAFLAGEFTDQDKVRYMPAVYEGPSEVKGAIASYTPGPGYIMVSHSFCKLGPGLRRKLIGHEFFHRWDDGLDGNPMLPGEAAEDAAYSVMRHL